MSIEQLARDAEELQNVVRVLLAFNQVQESHFRRHLASLEGPVFRTLQSQSRGGKINYIQLSFQAYLARGGLGRSHPRNRQRQVRVTIPPGAAYYDWSKARGCFLT